MRRDTVAYAARRATRETPSSPFIHSFIHSFIHETESGETHRENVRARDTGPLGGLAFFHPTDRNLGIARLAPEAPRRACVVPADRPQRRARTTVAAHYIRHFPSCPHGAPPEPGPLRCARATALVPPSPRPPPDATKPGARRLPASGGGAKARAGAHVIQRARARSAARAGGRASARVSQRTARRAPCRIARDRAPRRVANASRRVAWPRQFVSRAVAGPLVGAFSQPPRWFFSRDAKTSAAL